MELNWSTFLLEVINFLVLVWILKRFLYRPVLSVLEKRRQNIEQSLNEATDRHTKALELEQQYKKRLDEWALEKQQLGDALQLEIQTEKTKRLEQLQTELTSEREKTAVVEQRHLEESLRQYQHTAHQQAARFASHLLSAVASEELEARLFDLLIKTFDELDEERQEVLLNACNTSSEAITVTSSYNLSDAQHQQLEDKLCTLCGQSVKIKYVQDPQLLAGLRILIGASVLSMNLQDELNGFVELARENR